ncbi:MAG: alpha-1,2-fucosyltransferase [Spirochaetia bacterium]|jgi:hypothetical protein
MILYFTPGGRLGNQFFQLAMLHRLARQGEVCVTTRMEELLRLVDPGLRIVNIQSGILYRVVDRLCVPFLRALSRLGLFSSVIESPDWTWRRREGLLRRVLLVEGYFQNSELACASFRANVHVRPQHAASADHVLASVPPGARRVFVHLRRTDYLSYDILGKLNPSLPSSYYRELIQDCLASSESSYFVFLSDDPDYVEHEFSWLKRKYVSRNTPEVDFAIMTKCNDGILSNSSLCWWGAFYMAAPGRQWYPKYWLGWKSRAWYPPNIRPTFGIEVEIALEQNASTS